MGEEWRAGSGEFGRGGESEGMGSRSRAIAEAREAASRTRGREAREVDDDGLGWEKWGEDSCASAAARRSELRSWETSEESTRTRWSCSSGTTLVFFIHAFQTTHFLNRKPASPPRELPPPSLSRIRRTASKCCLRGGPAPGGWCCWYWVWWNAGGELTLLGRLLAIPTPLDALTLASLSPPALVATPAPLVSPSSAPTSSLPFPLSPSTTPVPTPNAEPNLTCSRLTHPSFSAAHSYSSGPRRLSRPSPPERLTEGHQLGAFPLPSPVTSGRVGSPALDAATVDDAGVTRDEGGGGPASRDGERKKRWKSLRFLVRERR